MKSQALYTFIIVFSIMVMVTMGCALASRVLEETQPSASVDPTLDSTIDAPPAITGTPAQANNETSEPVEAATATLPSPTYPAAESGSCTSDQCIFDGTFLLARPIGSTGRNKIDPTYRFGSNRANGSNINPCH